MKLREMIAKYTNDILISVIQVELKDETNEEILKEVKKTFGKYENLDALTVMLFKNNKGLAFFDFDCDGYRSGDWFVSTLEKLLDNGKTTTLKMLNEEVIDISFTHDSTEEKLMIQTTNHLIVMGQNCSDSYYPINFFDIEDCRKFALGETIEFEM